MKNKAQNAVYIDYWAVNAIASMAKHFRRRTIAGNKDKYDLTYKPSVIIDKKDIDDAQVQAFRRLGIGGSDVGAIFGTSRWKNNVELYYEKLGIRKAIPEVENWFQLSLGLAAEDTIAKLFELKTGFKIIMDSRIFRHPKYPFMLANIDRLAQMPDGTVVGVELKTTSSYAMDAWDNDQIPESYLWQVRHYMAVLNIDVWYIICIYGNTENDVVLRKVERNLAVETVMISKECEFWRDHVMKRTEPSITGSAELAIRTARAFSGYANKWAPPKKLPMELEPCIRKIVDLTRIKKCVAEEMDEQISEAMLPIVKAMGTSTKGRITTAEGKQFTVSYAPRSRRNTNLDKLEHLFPEAYAICVSKDPENSRPMQIKEIKTK